MKYLFFIVMILPGMIGYCQSRSMQLCFDIHNNGKPIDGSSIHKNELNSLSFTITYFNCGKSDIYIDTLPLIGQDYSNNLIFNDLGISSIIIRLFKKSVVDNYIPFFFQGTKKASLMKKRPKTLKLLPPNYYTITKGLSTDYFKSLPLGEYEVSLDYIDEVHPPYMVRQNVSKRILSKYSDKNGNVNPGYYMQFSKNTVRFTVIE